MLTLILVTYRVNPVRVTKRETFHHGDLRGALIRLARDELEKFGHHRLSLRELAAQLAVASSAPYRHFETKQALLSELALMGRTELHAAYATIPTGLPPRERLRRACEAYLEFAEQQPQLFRLLFNDDAFWREVGGDPYAEPSGYKLFEAIVAEVMARADRRAVRTTALGCWSAVHGLAMLRITGRLAGFPSEVAADAALLDLIAGIPKGEPT